MEVTFAAAPISLDAIAAFPALLVTCLRRGATSIHALISASVSFGAASVSFRAFAAAIAAFVAASSVVPVRALEAFRALGPVDSVLLLLSLGIILILDTRGLLLLSLGIMLILDTRGELQGCASPLVSAAALALAVAAFVAAHRTHHLSAEDPRL